MEASGKAKALPNIPSNKIRVTPAGSAVQCPNFSSQASEGIRRSQVAAASRNPKSRQSQEGQNAQLCRLAVSRNPFEV